MPATDDLVYRANHRAGAERNGALSALAGRFRDLISRYHAVSGGVASVNGARGVGTAYSV